MNAERGTTRSHRERGADSLGGGVCDAMQRESLWWDVSGQLAGREDRDRVWHFHLS
jgi:hypothetical protein